MSARRGFTALEIMVVIGIIATVSAMMVPMLLSSLRRGRLNDAANAVVQAASQARRMARQHVEASGYYGVTIVNGGTPSYVAVTYGTTAQASTVLTDTSGKPVVKYPFNANVLVYDGEDPLADGAPKAGWMYQSRTGTLIQTASPNAPAASITGLSLRTLDGRYRAAVALYSIGLVNVTEF